MLKGSEPVQVNPLPSSTTEFLLHVKEAVAEAELYWRDVYAEARADVKFAYVEQWDPQARAQRQAESRPCITSNHLPVFIDQILGDARQNRPSIKVSPAQSNARQAPMQERFKSVAGSKDYDGAELMTGLIRNIEQSSDAHMHYDTALQHAVEGGIGWLRVLTEYSKYDVFEQDLVIKSIRNRYSVMCDPRAVEPDLSDMEWCIVSERMRRAEFNKRYPNADVGEIQDIGSSTFWGIGDDVTVAEFFYLQPVKQRLLLLSTGEVVDYAYVKDVLDEIAAQGISVAKERTTTVNKVMWCKLTANTIIEKPVEVPFNTIPIIPVFGKEYDHDGIMHYRSAHRYAKGAQESHNFFLSAGTERIAQSPKRKWVVDALSVEGYETEWRNANISSDPMLRWNSAAGVAKPEGITPPPMPVAEMQMASYAIDEIKATTGIYDASLGNQSNETSGKAILARQRQGDRGSFAFIDNLARAVSRVGRLLLSAIPRIYDTERVVRVGLFDGSNDFVQINQTVIDQQTGREIIIYDMAAGKYDCVVDISPSYQTQRLESADSLMEFMRIDPQAAPLIRDVVAQNMDWAGSDAIAQRLKKGVPRNLLSPDEQKSMDSEQEPPQPTPQDQIQMAQIDADKARAEADKMMAQAKMAEAQVKMQEAQLAPVLMQQEQANQQAQVQRSAGGGVDVEMIRNIVADAIAEIMQGQR